MATANPFALIGNINPSLDDEDDDGEALLESALEEKRREAEQKLLDDDDDLHHDANKSDSRNQKQRNEGWVNEYRDKDVPEPDPSKPFVFSREWLLKLHRPDYAMPADFVFTPTITTQEPVPPVAFVPADEFVRAALTKTRQISFQLPANRIFIHNLNFCLSDTMAHFDLTFPFIFFKFHWLRSIFSQLGILWQRHAAFESASKFKFCTAIIFSPYVFASASFLCFTRSSPVCSSYFLSFPRSDRKSHSVFFAPHRKEE
jgi:hypothetical protein